MSTLALRNYGLVLPKNYVSIEKDEMEYIDGGWDITGNVFSFTIYLTHEERKTVTTYGLLFSIPAVLLNGLVAAALAAAQGIVANYDDGNGVSIRYGLFTTFKVSTLDASYWSSSTHTSSSGAIHGGGGRGF